MRRVAKFKVTLLVYDVSGGIANKCSQLLLGQQIEGIWHTGVQVDWPCRSSEFWLGGSSFNESLPETTCFGTPVKRVVVGYTYKSREQIFNYLAQILAPTFGKYDVLTNNCNHFSDELCMFLTNRHIPDEIRLQPKMVMKTWIARASRPLLNHWLGSAAGQLIDSAEDEDEEEHSHHEYELIGQTSRSPSPRRKRRDEQVAMDVITETQAQETPSVHTQSQEEEEVQEDDDDAAVVIVENETIVEALQPLSDEVVAGAVPAEEGSPQTCLDACNHQSSGDSRNEVDRSQSSQVLSPAPTPSQHEISEDEIPDEFDAAKEIERRRLLKEMEVIKVDEQGCATGLQPEALDQVQAFVILDQDQANPNPCWISSRPRPVQTPSVELSLRICCSQACCRSGTDAFTIAEMAEDPWNLWSNAFRR